MRLLRMLSVFVFFIVGAVSAQDATTITFDNLPDGAKVTNQYAGVVFTNATAITAGLTLNEFEFPPKSGATVLYNEGGAMTLVFTPPIYGVAGSFTYNSPLTMTAFDASGTQLGSVTSRFASNLALSGAAGSNPKEVLAFPAVLGIAKIVLTAAGNGMFVLDDLLLTTTVPTAFEADVSPRPNGSGTLTTADWVQVGRFFVRLDTPASGSEFQRADCAPKETKGDGILNISDWVQAGRYAVGLDPPVSVGGPTNPSAFAGPLATVPRLTAEGGNTAEAGGARAVTAVASTQEIATLLVQLEAQGNENALSLSLSFDPAVVRYASARLESGGQGMALIVSEARLSQGKLGLAVGLPPGQVLARQSLVLLKVSFSPVGADYPTSTPMRFGNDPLSCDVVDAESKALPTTFTDALVILRDRALGIPTRPPTQRRGVIRKS
jgi:hypothetical protein